jgi:hypothetical protein
MKNAKFKMRKRHTLLKEQLSRVAPDISSAEA